MAALRYQVKLNIHGQVSQHDPGWWVSYKTDSEKAAERYVSEIKNIHPEWGIVYHDLDAIREPSRTNWGMNFFCLMFCAVAGFVLFAGFALIRTVLNALNM